MKKKYIYNFAFKLLSIQNITVHLHTNLAVYLQCLFRHITQDILAGLSLLRDTGIHQYLNSSSVFRVRETLSFILTKS